MSLSKHNPDFSTYGSCSNPDEQYDPDWWFPEEKPGRVTWSRTYEANTARNICKSCPILVECRDYALQYHGITGIWGGMDRHERREMQIQLGIAPTSWEMSYPNPIWENTAHG
jgi:WhiB family redox-sensing transcriptional regulator